MLNSGASLVFTIKRAAYDEVTNQRLKGAAIDKTAVNAQYLDHTAGSVILTVKAGALDTLAVGEHVLTAEFEDGSLDIPFTVSAAAVQPTATPKPVPKTGDSDHPALWLGLMLLGLIGIAALGTLAWAAKRKK